MYISPFELEMNERKALLNKIVMDSQENPDIDIEKVLDTYQTFSSELEIYKYSGNNTRFQSSLTEELNTNAHGLQAFLQQQLSQYGISIYQFLISTIK